MGITNQVYRELVRKIQSQEATFVRKQSNRVTIWELEFADKQAVVAYDKVRKTVVTLIPAGEYYASHPRWKPKKS